VRLHTLSLFQLSLNPSLPFHISLSAFSAFPDSPQFDQGSQMHSFRIREQIATDVDPPPPPPPHNTNSDSNTNPNANTKDDPSSTSNTNSDQARIRIKRRPKTVDGFIYGYAHFTQRREASQKRGYTQVWFFIKKKSLTLFLC
jgi:hypothetical protein